jgi:hypothetical protein
MTSIESARAFWMSLHTAPLPLPDELCYEVSMTARGLHPLARALRGLVRDDEGGASGIRCDALEPYEFSMPGLLSCGDPLVEYKVRLLDCHMPGLYFGQDRRSKLRFYIDNGVVIFHGSSTKLCKPCTRLRRFPCTFCEAIRTGTIHPSSLDDLVWFPTDGFE